MKYTTCVYKYTPQRYLFDEHQMVQSLQCVLLHSAQTWTFFKPPSS